MIGVDKPPPEVGSQEWINLQKAEEEAASKDFTKVKLKYKIAVRPRLFQSATLRSFGSLALRLPSSCSDSPPPS